MKRVSQWGATVGVVVAMVSGCGGGAKEPTAASEPEAAEGPVSTAVAAADTPPASSAPKKEPSDVEVPTTCETRGSLCLPPAGFVKKLCQQVHPDLALAFFAKGTPFTRGYMRGAQDAFNGYGGVSSGDKLVFDEEVIVLSSRENKTGIEVSGASGQVDLLRWDGSCATVPAADVNYQLPPAPKTAAFDWKVLSDETQTALLADETIAKLNKERRNECKGASMGDVSKKCVKLVDQLRTAVVTYVRSGAGAIPAPTKLK